MSTPTVIKYPYDPTGLAVTNFVQDEIHTVPVVRNRAFALNAGPFFDDSVVVRHVDTGNVLTKDSDYTTLYLYQHATFRVGKPIVAVVFIVNPAISGTVSVDYQVVGGEFSSNVSAIQYLISTLEIDNRSIIFDDLLDLPVTFPPAPHLHDVGDLYGMEALIAAIEALRLAIESSGGSSGYTALYDALMALTQRVSANEAAINGLGLNVADLYNSLTSLLQRIIALEVRADETDDEIQDLVDAIGSVNIRLGQLEQLVNTFNTRITNVESAITDLTARVVAVEQSVAAVLSRIDSLEEAVDDILTDRDYMTVSGDYVVPTNRRKIYVATAGNGTLPRLADVNMGHCINFSHAHGIEPVYKVALPATETLSYKGATDTEIRHDIKESCRAIKTAANQWSIFV